MDMPFSIRFQTFRTALSTIIEKSGLPMCAIEVLLAETLTSVRIAAGKELEADAKSYKKECE